MPASWRQLQRAIRLDIWATSNAVVACVLHALHDGRSDARAFFAPHFVHLVLTVPIGLAITYFRGAALMSAPARILAIFATLSLCGDCVALGAHTTSVLQYSGNDNTRIFDHIVGTHAIYCLLSAMLFVSSCTLFLAATRHARALLPPPSPLSPQPPPPQPSELTVTMAPRGGGDSPSPPNVRTKADILSRLVAQRDVKTSAATRPRRENYGNALLAALSASMHAYKPPSSSQHPANMSHNPYRNNQKIQ